MDGASPPRDAAKRRRQETPPRDAAMDLPSRFAVVILAFAPVFRQHTPCLLALFSIVTLLAARLGHRARAAVWTDAWYRKRRPTFTDTLAAVRRQFWCERGLRLSWRSHAPDRDPPA